VWNRLKDEEKFFIIEVNFLLGAWENGVRLNEDGESIIK